MKLKAIYVILWAGILLGWAIAHIANCNSAEYQKLLKWQEEHVSG